MRVSRIARGMFLSRRTVQTYISRILTKLGAKSRVEIVREALCQGISPERDGRAVHRRESVVI
jgi:DNA-binding CsgD family transcriptional regulator